MSITYDCLGGNMYKIYLDLILDCSGAAPISQTIHFTNDCGLNFFVQGLNVVSQQEVSPLCGPQVANSTCNGGSLPGFKRYRYEVTMFLAPCNKWTIWWELCCRNTMVNFLTATPGMFVAATLDNTAGLCDDSPIYTESGVPFGCISNPISFNFGFTDPNAHEMVFSLVSARFFSGAVDGVGTTIPYAAGYSATQPIPGITIDPYTGQLNFSTNIAGYYVLVVQVTTYDADGKLIGTVIRDQLFVVNICDEAAPASPSPPSSTYGIFIGSNSVGVCDGQYFCADVVFSDSNPAAELTITSNVTTLLPGSTFTVTGTNPAVATICWTATAALLPNQIFVEATDNACPIDNVTSRSIFIGNCILLPVELLEFSAKPDRSTVLTEWSTASEQGSDYFALERSTDGTLFTVIGTVDGAGDSQQTLRYRFVDPAPVSGTSYYRLKQVDLDGTVGHSEVVPVYFSGGTNVTAQWDGGDGWTVHGLTANGEWTLVDMVGSVVGTGSFASEGPVRVRVNGLPDAFHMLIVRTPSEQHVLKLPPNGAQTTVTAVSKGI